MAKFDEMVKAMTRQLTENARMNTTGEAHDFFIPHPFGFMALQATVKINCKSSRY